MSIYESKRINFLKGWVSHVEMNPQLDRYYSLTTLYLKSHMYQL